MSILGVLSGCNFVPDIRHKPQLHNPFPQLTRVAVMPFRNQCQEPTLSGARVSMAYYNELQSVPGFEVVPFGVVENQLAFYETQVLKRPIGTPEDFQLFAKHLGVDAVLQGAITDYDPYYPPRMTLKVNWYASNPGLHPIPVGYGLPWGTKEEKKIPNWIRLESERALAREQIATQTPQAEAPTSDAPVESMPRENPPKRREVQKQTEPNDSQPPAPTDTVAVQRKERIALARIQLPILPEDRVVLASYQDNMNAEAESANEFEGAEIEEPARIPPKLSSLQSQTPLQLNPDGSVSESSEHVGSEITLPAEIAEDGDALQLANGEASNLPPDWPDPKGFVPPRPMPQRPTLMAQNEPVISHMKAYNGNDEDFTQSLQEYYYFRDDARFGGWQSYLQRSEDFIRFCCHLHISETLSSRGGQLESRLNLRWPISRYDR